MHKSLDEFEIRPDGTTGGLGAKMKKNRSVAPPRKKNSIATMHHVYISGAWKTMFD